MTALSPTSVRLGRGSAAKRPVSLFTGMAMSLAGGVFAGLGGLALTLVVARGLGPVEAGAFFVAVGVFTIASNTVELGADTGLVWSTPRLRAVGRPADVRRTLIVAVVPVLIAGIVAAALVAIFSDPLADVFMKGDNTALGGNFLRDIAPYLAAAPLATVLLAGTRGFGSYLPLIGIQSIGLPLVRPLVIGILVGVGAASGAAVAAAWGAPWIIAAILGAIILRSQSHQMRAGESVGSAAASPWKSLFREFWAFASVRAFAGVAEITLVWLDVLLVAWLVGPLQAGIYAVASRFITTGSLALQASRVAISPRLSKLISTNRKREAEEVLHGGARLVIVLSWPLYIGLAMFAPVVLRIFGHGFGGGALPLAILALASLVDMGTGNVANALLMAGASRWNLINSVVAVVVDVVVDIILIPNHGATGAAIGWAAAIVLVNLMACAELEWSLHLRPSDSTTMITALVTGAVCGAAGLIVLPTLGRTVVGLVVWTSVSLATLAVWIWRQPHYSGFNVLSQAISDRAGTPAKDNGVTREQ